MSHAQGKEDQGPGPRGTGRRNCSAIENFEKGPTDKAKDPDPGGSDQQNLGYKKLKNRKADRTVGLNYIYIFSNISSGTA